MLFLKNLIKIYNSSVKETATLVLNTELDTPGSIQRLQQLSSSGNINPAPPSASPVCGVRGARPLPLWNVADRRYPAGCDGWRKRKGGHEESEGRREGED